MKKAFNTQYIEQNTNVEITGKLPEWFKTDDLCSYLNISVTKPQSSLLGNMLCKLRYYCSKIGRFPLKTRL